MNCPGITGIIIDKKKKTYKYNSIIRWDEMIILVENSSLSERIIRARAASF